MNIIKKFMQGMPTLILVALSAKTVIDTSQIKAVVRAGNGSGYIVQWKDGCGTRITDEEYAVFISHLSKDAKATRKEGADMSAPPKPKTEEEEE